METPLGLQKALVTPARTLRAIFGAALFLAVAITHVFGQASVTTWRNDTQRTGQNLNESVLTPSNVNTAQFGRLFSQPVDGYVFAQPLYLPNVTIGGQLHNVVFVATEHDSVYAFDADTNGGVNASPLWFASLITTAHDAAPGATTVPASDTGADIVPEVGITGTPVIDPVSGTYYVVGKTLEGSTFVQRLHALDVSSGAEKFGGPVVITATVPGTGNGSVRGALTFDPEWENQRPGLLLINGIVYIGWGSHGDVGPWHGWILAYNATTLQQTGVFCATPNGVGAGIWMGGAGLAAEVIDPVNHPYGRMFVPTGNGDYTANIPYAPGMDYGDSILNLDLTNGALTVQDNFTPANQAALDAADTDIGSGGLMILPTQTSGNYPNLLVQAGKAGEVYLLDRDSLGGYNPAGDQVVQEIPAAVGETTTNGTWSMGAYYNGVVYYAGSVDHIKAFPLVNGQLTGPTLTSSDLYHYPGANPVISANGNTQGLLWAINSSAYNNGGPQVLEAYDPTVLGKPLYSSSKNLSRDDPGPAVKFTVPAVVNGKVYVGAQYQLSVFGLLSNQQVTATPMLSPGAETFSGSLAVTITDATPGAIIYYTLDGSTPTANSSIYAGPITISVSTTINALAGAPGYDQSAVASTAYTLSSQVATPVITPGPGTYTNPVPVSINDASTGATIYYTTDGSNPATSSAAVQYSAPFTISATETVNAVAEATGSTTSGTATAAYTLEIGATGIDFSEGFASTEGIIILNGSAGLDDSRLQMTNGGQNEASSAWYYQPVNVQAFDTIFTFQLSNPGDNGITFAIQGNSNSSLGASGSGLGYQGISNSLAVKFDFSTPVGLGTDSTGLYINGASPTVPAIDLSTSGISLSSDDLMIVELAYNGSILSMTITDDVTGAAYSTSWPANIPSIIGGSSAYVGFTGGTTTLSSSQKLLTWEYVAGSEAAPLTTTPIFSPPGGSYNGTQTVSMSSLTSGAAIYYTTDGSIPTTSSPVYSAPIAVSNSSTLNALAVAPGYGWSTTGTGVYTITPILPAPSYSPAPGSYPTTQTVTISDTNAAAAIYYTTNGTAPTTSSAVYIGPITVSATETLEAIAVASGYANSPTATATFTINPNLPAPTFTPAGGTFTSAQNVTISDATAGTTIYYTTDGSTPTASSTNYSGPITVGATQTLQAIAAETGFINSSLATAGFTIIPVLPSPTFSPAGGTFTTAQAVTVSDSTAGATIYYTTNGSTPTTSSNAYTGPITVSTTETLQAIAVEAGFTNSSASAATLTINPVLPAPTFSPAGGNYSTTQTVTISDPTAGTAIYYTTNGTTPTTSSNAYSGAITVSSTETLQAIAVETGYTNSPAVAATYTIGTAPAAATPVFSPAGAHYSTAQTVTITDATSNASIYYTTNGTAPTGSSSVYTGAITVGSSETIEAIAIAPSYSQSKTATAIYTLPTAVPVINPPGGAYNSVPTITITDSMPGAIIYYTLNNTTPSTSSPVYSGPFTVTNGQTVKAGAIAPGSTQSSTVVANYGLKVATPVISPGAGNYSSPQAVTITDTTPGTTIYYTTNGTVPTTSSNVYSNAISVNSSQTIEALGVSTGYTNSTTATAIFAISAAAPTFSLPPGSYSSAHSVSITSASAGATIYYTTNGTTPTTSSTVYSGPIIVGASETLQAIAGGTGYVTSPVASATYTIAATPATPAFSPAGGTYTSVQTVSISDSTASTVVYYTTNGTAPTTSASVYGGPISVSATETLEAIAAETDGTTSAVASATYNINPVLPAPSFSPTSGTYTTNQTVSISDATAGTAIYYTTNGTAPTTSSTAYTGPITLSATETLQAIAVETAYTNSPAATAIYNINPVLPLPAFSPAGGIYTTTQTVTISETTAGTTIYYTTNGTTPTTSSTVYTGPVSITSTETLQAIAVGTGYTNSPAAPATYNINPLLPSPTFSPAGGTYTTTQTVSISAAAGSTIYYTTNGTTPTISSSVYNGPITVSATETLEAIAVETGYTNSPAAPVTYNINPLLPLPTFSPAGGAYSATQTVTISETTAGTTIYYTTNGTPPTTSSSVYSSPITVNTSETLEATAVETGYTNSQAGTATYTINSLLPPPTFTPAGGTFTTTQTVTISEAPAGTTIYYTIDGSTPTTSSPVYSGPITVSSTLTLQAIAVESGYTNSSITAATYNISPLLSAPMFSPAGGTFTTTQTVTISATTGTTIYFTTNGTTPTTSSAVYSGPLTASTTETLEAIAVETGYTNSPPSVATININPALAAPAISPAGGTFTTSQTVTISAAAGTTIYYTTNGSTPTPSSAVYSSPITVSATETLQAIAVETGYTNSPASAATITINPILAAPAFSPAGGNYTSAQTVTISDATAGATIYYTTNGTPPTTSSSIYGTPIPVSATETLEAFAVETGYTNSQVAMATFAVSTGPAAATPVFSPAGAHYSSPQTVTITDATANATIYYTTNGTAPTTSSNVYTGAIAVGASETIEAIAIAPGYSPSKTATATYTLPTTPPVISPPGGTYNAAPIVVTITDSMAGATIYYTLDNSAPSLSSPVYTGPFAVTNGQTVKAGAIASGSTQSTTAIANYGLKVATPVITPASGSYTGAQTVTITDITPGATIYYTTNGTAPTASSNVYSSAITVNASLTIQAIGVSTGYTNSSTASASFTIAGNGNKH